MSCNSGSSGGAMWSSTVGLVNGKHRYLTAETFGFKISSNGQQLKRRQQWTIEPFPENTGPDGSISSAASVSSVASPAPGGASGAVPNSPAAAAAAVAASAQPIDPSDPCILMTLSSGADALGVASANSPAGSASSQADQDACGEEHENVAIKSHLNKYLAVDSFGNVTCDSDEKTENARFTITICSMSQSRSKEEHIFWAFKNVERGYYLGTTDDGMICCSAKMPKSRAELWHLHLLPARGASFFAIKSLGRKRFARVSSAGPADRESAISGAGAPPAEQQVQLDANISWGPETLFQFQYHEGGKYSLLTSDQRLLTNEGKCIDWERSETATPSSNGGAGEPVNSAGAQVPPPECLFTLEYHSGYLAFRDSFSQYLAAAGRSSVLRSRSIGVSRDELFVFEPAPIQVSLKATFNNRWVSIKQGVDVSANQVDTTSTFETFQMTYHKQTQLWSIMTHDCNYWTASANSTISVCRPGDYEGLTRGQFKLVWSDSDASFSVKFVDVARQERWLSARKSGQLYLAPPTGRTCEPVTFIMRFQNRRLLSLRPVEGSGFVGLRSAASKQLEGNKAAPDSLEIEYSESLPASNGLTSPTAAAAAATLEQLKAAAGERREEAVASKFASQDPRVISVFNVKLNQTKMGQNVFERLSGAQQAIGSPQQTAKQQDKQHAADVQHEQQPGEQASKQEEPDMFGIDANNNNSFADDKLDSSGVDSVSAPSVASIINSFSSAKISNGQSQAQQQAHSGKAAVQSRPVGSAVSKLASSFESSPGCGHQVAASSPADQQQQQLIEGGQPSSCDEGAALEQDGSTTSTHLDKSPCALVDQVAQSECCYLKMKANNKYLVQGEIDSSGAVSVLCDATNKACAQAWILELRSHNSIAIRASDNHAYMQIGTNGTIFLARCEPDEASLWEF